MNHSASQPRLTRGAHDPKAHANNIVGLFSQIIPLLAYVGRTLNDTMCDHVTPDICDRCQRKLHTLGTLISGSASAVAMWSPSRLAELNARLAIAAARRLLDTVELGHPVVWAMKGGTVLTTARRAVFAAAALLDDPDLGAMNHAQDAASQCTELDLSTSRVARKQGLVAESFIIGYLLKAASKAACAAVAATETGWAQAGETRQLRLGLAVEGHAGAAVGAALDAAALLDIDPGRAEAMMVVATGVCAEFDRLAEAEVACEKSTSQKVTPGVSPEAPECACDCPCTNPVELVRFHPDGPLEPDIKCHACNNDLCHVEPAALPAWLNTPTEEYNVLDDFNESELGDVADEAIGDAAALQADLERAEAILNAIAEEHRAVEQVVRTTRDNGANAGLVTEHYQKCCVVCRDVKGRPVPSPCRTQKIIQGFGE